MINVAHPDGTPVYYVCPCCGYPQISEKQWREEYQNNPDVNTTPKHKGGGYRARSGSSVSDRLRRGREVYLM